MDVVSKPYKPFMITDKLLEQHIVSYISEIHKTFSPYTEIELDKLSEEHKKLLAPYISHNVAKYLDEEDHMEVHNAAGPFTLSADPKIPRHCEKYLECFIPVFIRGMKKNKYQKIFEFFSNNS